MNAAWGTIMRPRIAIRRALGVDRGRRRRLSAAADGAAMVEFAIVGPVFITMLAAIVEFSAIMFVQTLLEGSAREASRYGITGFTQAGISRDEQILELVDRHTLDLIDMDELELETLVYENFADVGQPEPYTDENDNGTWDVGEPYTDVNENGAWDEDMGEAGLGGPGDVVVYRMRYDWPIMIPLFEPFFGQTVTLRANVAVRNEPFD